MQWLYLQTELVKMYILPLNSNTLNQAYIKQLDHTIIIITNNIGHLNYHQQTSSDHYNSNFRTNLQQQVLNIRVMTNIT